MSLNPRSLAGAGRRLYRLAAGSLRRARSCGLRYTVRRCREKASERLFHRYDRSCRQSAPGAAELERQRAEQPDAGLISIAVPVYNTSPRMLREMLDSFLAQTYRDWEACLYDASDRAETREVLREYAARDARIRVTFGEENNGISGNTNRALAMCRGGWVALCDHDDLYTPDALWRIAREIARQNPDVLYTDEDKISEDSRYYSEPHFKPDFCPDNLRSSNYVCHLLCVRRTLLEALGGERSAFDGSQDHDLTLRCAERTDRIAHIPEICYHWRTVGGSESHQHLERCMEAACRATEEHMARIGFPGRAVMEDGLQRLFYDLPRDRSTALVLLTGPDGQERRLREAVRAFGWEMSVRSVPGEDPRALAEAVREGRETYVLLMDTRVCPKEAGFADELLMYAQRSDVGAVIPAAVTVFRRIVHAGYAVDGRGGFHARNRGLVQAAGGFHQMAMRAHNVSAVAPLCLMARREALRTLDGGWDSVGAAIGAWCLSAQAEGLRHVYTPWARCVWRGGRFREEPRTPRDAAGLAALLPEGWEDPCWNRHLDMEKTDYRMKR